MPKRTDLPLIEWGNQLRARRVHARKRKGRLYLGAIGIAFLGATIAFPPPPFLVWNSSASAPEGLYWLSHNVPIERGDMVVAYTPEPYRQMAARRHYLPANIPLVKRVAAIEHDLVCATGPEILINNMSTVTRRRRDGQGRSMPWWQGCATLREGALFMLMDADPASFDGRYFGITRSKDIIAKAHLIWAR